LLPQGKRSTTRPEEIAMPTIIQVPTGGIVIEVYVKKGDNVTPQQHLFAVELGKTLLIQRATVAGTVTDVAVKPGDPAVPDTPAVTIA
jgi:biotin carboxyl carrier protein